VASVVDSLRATVPALVAFVTGSPVSAFRRRPDADEWSAAMVLTHMADAEMVYGVRFRVALAEPGGLLPGFDESAWAARFSPFDDDPSRSLARFRALRENTIAIIESVSGDEWDRVGLHEEFGELSVRRLAERLMAHDAGHLDQIRAALAS
jgi:hypothetical protein